MLGSVKVMSVRPVATDDTFCTIMSMFTPASATAVKICAASPGLSGTPTTVILASPRSWATPEMIGASICSSAGIVDDPGAGLRRERRAHVDRHSKTTGVLDTPQVQDLRARRGHLEHLFVREALDAAGGRDDARIGSEDPVDVGVDLANFGLQGGRERDRGRVRTATTEGGDVLGVLGHALEPGDDRDVALVERLANAAGRDVDDAAPCRASSR